MHFREFSSRKWQKNSRKWPKILKNAIYDHSSIINELTLLLVNESVIFFRDNRRPFDLE